MTMDTLWVGLPAYNEEAAISALFGRFEAVFPGKSLPYRIVLYNDGSTDGTLFSARAWEDRLNVEVIGRPENLGLGAGLRALVSYVARNGGPQDVLVIMDCDDTHPPGLIPSMTAALDAGCDIVIASRYRNGARIEGVTAHRRLLSLGAALLFKALHPCRGVLDYTSGYRGYRVSLLQRALAHYGDNLIREQGFACMVELLLKLNHLGARACEVPIDLRYDLKKGASKMDLGGNTRRLLSNLLSWRFRGLK